MSKIRVHCFGVSLDGFSSGPHQSLENPLGVNGLDLMQWFFPTRVFQRMHGGNEVGTTGVDNDFAERSFQNVGAWILGRNMFGPVRGPWPDESWKGWWGENPPYHTQVFVLTHHARPALEMAGGTTFHFVTEGIQVALERARAAAGGQDVRIGGGAATVRQYLQAGVIDEMHLAVSPTILGSGERAFEGIDLVKLGYRCKEQVMSPAAMHVVLMK
ncbi:MAG TPA: dihydrofolate reductase family protein [Verrucomicrobiae bacterium]